MVLDNEVCDVKGCTLHTGWEKTTPISYQNRQIRSDWKTGHWTVEELAAFWGVSHLSIIRTVNSKSKIKDDEEV
jgi:hypothetical protein